MKLDVKSLKTERQWRSTVGMPSEKFYALLPAFIKSYEAKFQKTLEQRVNDCPNNPSITSYESLLLFTLFSLKAGLSYDLLGFVSGMDGSNAKRNQTLGIEILKEALKLLVVLPQQNLEKVEDFVMYFSKEKSLIIDATEQAIQRPKNQENQKDMYSGKKKDIH